MWVSACSEGNEGCTVPYITISPSIECFSLLLAIGENSTLSQLLPQVSRCRLYSLLLPALATVSHPPVHSQNPDSHLTTPQVPPSGNGDSEVTTEHTAAFAKDTTQEHFTVRDQLNGNKWLRCTRSEAVDYRDCDYKFFKANGQTFRPYASTGDVHPDAFCRQKEEIQNVENTLEDDESLTAVKFPHLLHSAFHFNKPRRHDMPRSCEALSKGRDISARAISLRTRPTQAIALLDSPREPRSKLIDVCEQLLPRVLLLLSSCGVRCP